MRLTKGTRLRLTKEEIELVDNLSKKYVVTKDNETLVRKTMIKHSGKGWVNGWLTRQIATEALLDFVLDDEVVKYDTIIRSNHVQDVRDYAEVKIAELTKSFLSELKL